MSEKKKGKIKKHTALLSDTTRKRPLAAVLQRCRLITELLERSWDAHILEYLPPVSIVAVNRWYK